MKTLGSILICVLLSACQAFQPTVPTHHTDQIYTQAAKTMVAGKQATQRAMPSSTPTTPATQTRTRAPVLVTTTAPAAVASTETVTPTAVDARALVPASPSATLQPLINSTAAPGDGAEFVYLSPGKGVNIQKNTAFDFTLNIKNVGSKTWNKGYYLAYASGDALGSPKDYFLTKETRPGETFTFVFQLRAPNETGKKQVIWAFRDDKDADLLYIDLDVNVTE